MFKVICVGSASKDIFFPTRDGVVSETPKDIKSQRKITFELGAKYHIENRYEALGGCAANVSAGLAKLGLKVACLSKTGDDSLGKWIVAELRKGKVSTEIIQVGKNTPSDLSAIIIDQKSGERTIFFNRDANENLKIDSQKLADAGYVFVSALNSGQKEVWSKNLEKILRCRKKGVKLAFNPGSENIRSDPRKVISACRLTDILVVNKDEAIEIVSEAGGKYQTEELNNEIFLLTRLKNLTLGVIAITDGKKGAWAFDGKKMIYAKAGKEKPIDTTGAGDAFTSAFIAALVKNRGYFQALQWGIVNSNNSVKFYGAHAGLCNEKEIQQMSNKVKIKIIN